VEVEHRLKRLRETIHELPPKPSGDPVSAIWKMKTAFENDVKQLVEGCPEQGAAGLVQTFRRLKQQFRDAIFRQAPKFKPFERSAGHGTTGPELRAKPVTQREPLEPPGETDPSNFVYIDEVLETARK